MNRRSIVGLLSIGLLATGAALYITAGGSGAGAACVRVGALLAAVWLAYRDLQKIPFWMLGSIMIAAAAIAWRPKLIVIVVPILIAFWFLRPRPAKSPHRQFLRRPRLPSQEPRANGPSQPDDGSA